MSDTEDRFHEKAGARLLELFFPSVVVDCCRFHVAAKRYLCATDPDYFDTLSDASVHSLTLQGGAMCAGEAGQIRGSAAFPRDRRGPISGRCRQAARHGDAGRSTTFAPMLRRMVDARHGDASGGKG